MSSAETSYLLGAVKVVRKLSSSRSARVELYFSFLLKELFGRIFSQTYLNLLSQ